MKNGKNKLDSLEGEIEDSIEDIKPKVVRSMNKATDCSSMLVFTNLQIANIQTCKLQIYNLANCKFTNLQIANLRACKLQLYEIANCNFTNLLAGEVGDPGDGSPAAATEQRHPTSAEADQR